MSEPYQPPFAITPEAITLVSEISELVGSIAALEHGSANPRLRRDNRIRTIHASLAIENNSLSLDQVTAVIDGRRVLGAPGEIREVKNAYDAYEHMLGFDPYSVDDMLEAHRLMMRDLVQEAGAFRRGGVGVFNGERLIHLAPPASLVPGQVADLLAWVERDPVHPLIKSCVFHYEFEFIHPFADGNGRMGRMWQTLILARWRPLFAWLPIETLIRERQDAYYAALGASDRVANATPMIAFLLTAIRDALREAAPVAETRGTMEEPVRRLLNAMGAEALSAVEIMERMGLKSRASFRKNYLSPALEQGWIEMTLPDRPNSRKQRYKRKAEPVAREFTKF